MAKTKTNEWSTDINYNFKRGQKIEAVIRHCNKKLQIPDETVVLKASDDGFYIGNSSDELSYNWDIIKWRVFKKIKNEE